MKSTLTIFMLVCIRAVVTAQVPEIIWQLNVGGNGWDELRSMEETADGGIIVGGFSYSGISGDKTEMNMGTVDFWIVKVDPFGAIEWQNTIGGDAADQCYFVQQTADLGYICGGWSKSDVSYDKTVPTFGGRDCWLVKLDAGGEIEWQQAYGGSEDDYLFAFDNTADGGYVLGCFSASGATGNKTEPNYGSMDYWIIKIDSLGNIDWQNALEGYGDDRLHGIQQTADGGYIVGGTTDSPMGGDKSEDVFGEEDYWVVKLDALGNIEWDNNIGGNSEDEQFSIIQTIDGGYFLGGFSTSPVSGDKTEDAWGAQDYWAVKLSSIGEIEWQNNIGGASGDRLEYVLQDPAGYYFLGGSSLSQNDGDKEMVSYGLWDFWAIQLNESGTIDWQLSIGGDGDDVVRGINLTRDGGVVIGGQSSSGISGNKTVPNQGDYDFYLVKLGCPSTGFFEDLDGDGYGSPDRPLLSCNGLPGFVANNTDCDDTNMFIHPGMTELENGLDDDCNTLIDDVAVTVAELNSAVQVYPNPFNQFVYISIRSGSNADSFILVNAQGQTCRKWTASSTANILATGDLPAGVYYLYWNSAEGSGRKMLIHQ
jgi:hypothetical protein